MVKQSTFTPPSIAISITKLVYDKKLMYFPLEIAALLLFSSFNCSFHNSILMMLSL